MIIISIMSIMMSEYYAVRYVLHERSPRSTGDVYKTRELSPFLECVDNSPVVRSVLPKLLLQYRYRSLALEGNKYRLVCLHEVKHLFCKRTNKKQERTCICIVYSYSLLLIIRIIHFSWFIVIISIIIVSMVNCH